MWRQGKGLVTLIWLACSVYPKNLGILVNKQIVLLLAAAQLVQIFGFGANRSVWPRGVRNVAVILYTFPVIPL